MRVATKPPETIRRHLPGRGSRSWRLFRARLSDGDAPVNAPLILDETDRKSPQPERLVVIGNGMAGCRAVEEVLARDPARYAITIFGAEPRVNYNRIMLSPVLAGEKAFEEIVINAPAWYEDNGI